MFDDQESDRTYSRDEEIRRDFPGWDGVQRTVYGDEKAAQGREEWRKEQEEWHRLWSLNHGDSTPLDVGAWGTGLLLVFGLVSMMIYKATYDYGPPPQTCSVRDVQRELMRAGCDPGPLDGVIGARTKAALVCFQRAQGLPETGAITR